MRIKATATPIIIAGFIVAIFFSFIAIAAIDAPHNASNNISCGSCHGEALFDSPFWGGSYDPANIDDTAYNKLCLSCHRAPFGPYSEISAPLVKTHSSLQTSNKYGTWTRECRTCHDPHYQKQKNYKNTDAGNLYLATGTITSCVYNPPVPPAVVGTSTLTYSAITYKSGWNFVKLTEKTGDYRRTILFPNVGKLGYNYPVIAVDTPTAGTITVTGDATPVYQYISSSSFAAMYGQYSKDSIDIKADPSVSPPPASIYKTVKFFDQTGAKSFADGDTTYNGVCEVCHTLTSHYRNDGGGSDADHSATVAGGADGINCMECHDHTKGFAHGSATHGIGCDACHGHDAGWQGNANLGKGTFKSHSTHTENDSDDLRGPNLTCGTCHDTNNFPRFSDGQDLTGTTVCDGCHSSGGVFNGVNTASGSVGAKENWASGVYSGSVLTAGKERWCVGCHDSGVSVIGERQAPNVAGNNTTYGYYVSGHGSPGTECGACHGLDMNHNFDNKRTYASASNNYKQGYRLKDVAGQNPLNIPAPGGPPCSYNAGNYRLCYSCHNEQALISDTKSRGVYDCTNNPYKNAPAITTQFRNESLSGLNGGPTDVPANIHWDHLVDTEIFASLWNSDRVGPNDSRTSCVTCHNPHGDYYGAGTSTIKMTLGDFQITWGTDVNGDYGYITGPNAYNANRCGFSCHGTNTKYYRPNP